MSTASTGQSAAPIALGSRRELFVDDHLIDRLEDLHLELARPERRESFAFNAPWEDSVAGALSLQPWEDRWRLYYRAGILDLKREDQTSVVALAETRDGIHFERPELGLVEFGGSKANNILQIGGFPNVPPAFVDSRPGCPPEERCKGITFQWAEAYAMCSADGLRWRPLQKEKLALPGMFDSINTGFWDSLAGCYRCFTRSWYAPARGQMVYGDEFRKPGGPLVRAIQHATSPDFLHWSEPQGLIYADGDLNTELYTNSIMPCPGAEHIYVGFPNRFLAKRKVSTEHEYAGINDALFMASRDALHWTRYRQAWIRPGLDPKNWTDRNNYPVWGIVTACPTEWSMYVSEHYRQKDTPTCLRRLAIRPWGFVSLRAGERSGQMVSKPLTFTGKTLRLNYSSSAAGSVQAELQNQQGQPLAGFAFADMAPLYGDELDAPLSWQGGGDLSAHAGKPVRLALRLLDADVYAFRFTA